MGVIAAVLRCRFVREDLVVGHVVEIQIVACWTANDWRIHAKIADKSSHRDVHNAVAKAWLNLADQSVSAENAQSGKSRVIRIRPLLSPVTSKTAGICG